ncbi:hypothetical protein PC116_g31623 [Phytophthora cactorum]|nr:hypothetical protein PC116_g31623 [Phytophthora cactorum]
MRRSHIPGQYQHARALPKSSAQTLATFPVRPCEDIAIDANITTKQLTQWNPWVGSDCDKGIYADLAAADTRPVCIGTNSTDSPTQTMIPTSSPSPSPTRSSSSAAPTQTGIAAGCTKYHIAVKGDGCWAVANQYGITLDQFYAWNPAGESML